MCVFVQNFRFPRLTKKTYVYLAFYSSLDTITRQDFIINFGVGMANESVNQTDQEIRRISYEEYRDFKTKLIEDIRNIINKINGLQIASDLKDKVRTGLNNIISSLNSIFLHYDEMGF